MVKRNTINYKESFAVLRVIANKKIKPSVRKELLAQANPDTIHLLREILFNLVRNTLGYRKEVLRTKFRPYRNIILKFIDYKKHLTQKERKSLFLRSSIGWQFINNLFPSVLDRFVKVFKSKVAEEQKR